MPEIRSSKGLVKRITYTIYIVRKKVIFLVADHLKRIFKTNNGCGSINQYEYSFEC